MDINNYGASQNFNNQGQTRTGFQRQQRYLTSQTPEVLHLDLTDPCLRGDNLEYDEIDLISECSTPYSYTPGKFLQLCDISAEETKDVTLWPEPSGSDQVDTDMTRLIPSPGSLCNREVFKHTQPFRTSQRTPLLSQKFLVPIAVCVIIALTALSGLAMML